MNNYRKLYAPAAALLAAIGNAIADGSVDATELGTIGAAVFVLLGVWALPNTET